jgi:hypothetical protein
VLGCVCDDVVSAVEVTQEHDKKTKFMEGKETEEKPKPYVTEEKVKRKETEGELKRKETEDEV